MNTSQIETWVQALWDAVYEAKEAVGEGGVEDFDYSPYFAAKEAAYRKVRAINTDARSRGEILGRNVYFGVADGHAQYVVAEEDEFRGEAMVRLIRVPNPSDDYRHIGVGDDGWMKRDEVQTLLKLDDTISRLWPEQEAML